MQFVDTNYFLRFLLKDINAQHLEVKNLFLLASEGKTDLITSTIAIFEIYWVLSSYYKKDRSETVNVLNKILNLRFIQVEERQILIESIALFSKTKLDLEDCYNIYYAKSKGIKSFKTFDKKLIKEFNKELRIN
jgi:predicted nucleic-acid-binding protein